MVAFGANLEWDILVKLGKKFNMYKLERKENESSWYQVMLSPFKTREDVKEYHAKYSKYYPNTTTMYRVTNLETGGMKVIR